MPSRIWIDLDNTPHAPFFKPIIEILEANGHIVILTARRMSQLISLADDYQLNYTPIGKHAGKSKLKKIAALFSRAFACYRFLGKPLPDIALSHGARSQILAANLLKVPTVEFIDYEHVATPPLCKPKWEVAPNCYPTNVSRVPHNRFRSYPGIKEDVYAAGFKPSGTALKELGISNEKIIVTIRPPATEAHYHNNEADQIFDALIKRILSDPTVHAIVIPRNETQRREIADRYLPEDGERKPEARGERAEARGQSSVLSTQNPQSAIHNPQFTMPRAAFSGLDLIWESDLVIGGGGTMTREAASLNTPSYSFFRGTPGAVDTQLVKEKRLTLIECPADIETKIAFQKKPPSTLPSRNADSLNAIIAHIESILEFEGRSLRTED